MNISITLSKKDIAKADWVARRRHESSIERGYLPKNGAPTEKKAALAIDIRGARAEMAAALWLEPRNWEYLPDKVKGVADFDGWIDAKAIRKYNHRLIVKQDALVDWAYLAVCSEDHPTYNIMGWCYGYEAKQIEPTDPTGHRDEAHFIELSNPMIKPPQLLKEINDAKNKMKRV